MSLGAAGKSACATGELSCRPWSGYNEFTAGKFMKDTVSPARAIDGIITLPGDKSISHRYAMLAGIAEGASTLANYSTGADCQSTLAALAALGAAVERRDANVIVTGGMLHQPAGDLDAGNSGSTIRMLSGILAAQP